jgi:anti-sigma regulatory factor (Ser/Thr protein kinase)
VEIAREALVHLTPDASSLREGRRFVAETLRDWQFDEARIEPVQLVANELMANAIVHAHSAPVLSLEEAGPDLTLRVADTSPNAPVRRADATKESGGRGLLMVEALADKWGFDANSSGKVVWVTFAGAFDGR